MFRYLVSRALAKGSRRGLQGSQFWAVVAILAGTVRVVEWLNRPTKRDVVWRQVLGDGDRFEVVVRPRGKGKQSGAAR